jgi:hypothetical protein
MDVRTVSRHKHWIRYIRQILKVRCTEQPNFFKTTVLATHTHRLPIRWNFPEIFYEQPANLSLPCST